ELIALEKLSVESQALLRTVGDWNAINSRWPRAIRRFMLLTQLDPPEDPGATLDHFRLGAALVESGQPDEYERLRQQVVSRFRNVGSAVNTLPDRLIKTCLMLPADRQLLE